MVFVAENHCFFVRFSECLINMLWLNLSIISDRCTQFYLLSNHFFFKVCLNMIKELYRIETNKQFAAFCLHKGSFKPMLISVGTSFNGMQARYILYVYFFFFSCTLYVIHIIPCTCADRRGWGPDTFSGSAHGCRSIIHYVQWYL